MVKDWIDHQLVRDFAAEQTDAYRICTTSGGWAERLGRDVLISHKSDAARDVMLNELPQWSSLCGVIFDRVFARFLPKRNAERESPKPISGSERGELKTVVSERALRFGIDFTAGYSVGLFLDQRENRQFVRTAAPRRLLNCFAYTCSFSIAAAVSGATTLNIDLSKKSLGRGKENLGLNGLAPDDHRFLAEDVMTALPRLARKGEKFDMIILDPPTFSRSHTGQAFQVEQDFERLLTNALDVATREARILLSTNCTALTERTLEVMARFCLKTAKRAGTFHHEPPLPDFRRGTGASTVWLTLR
jgi:23S rRNA (cytosine1962-C5)-methyltransferase